MELIGSPRNFKEGQEKKTYLPEDDLEVIVAITEHQYSGAVPYIDDEDFTRDPPTKLEVRAAKVYVAAVKYCLEELHNEMVDLLTEMDFRRPSVENIHLVFSIFPDASSMGQLLPHNIACVIQTQGWEWVCKELKWRLLIEEGGELACEIVNCLGKKARKDASHRSANGTKTIRLQNPTTIAGDKDPRMRAVTMKDLDAGSAGGALSTHGEHWPGPAAQLYKLESGNRGGW